jgi:hypothetical protein
MVLGKENLENLELVPSDQGMYEQAGEMHQQVLGQIADSRAEP